MASGLLYHGLLCFGWFYLQRGLRLVLPRPIKKARRLRNPAAEKKESLC